MFSNSTTNSTTNQPAENNFDIKYELYKYIIYWKWFVVSVILFLFLAYTFLRYAEVKYKSNIVIIIKQDKERNLASELTPLTGLGLSKNANLIDNQIEILKSRTLIEKTVKRINLNLVYTKSGIVRKTEVYGTDCPIQLKFLNKDLEFYKKDTLIEVNGISEKYFELKNEKGNAVKYEYDKVIDTKIGPIMISKSNIFDFDSPGDYKFIIDVK